MGIDISPGERLGKGVGLTRYVVGRLNEPAEVSFVVARAFDHVPGIIADAGEMVGRRGPRHRHAPTR
jgi:hypothetical protein